MTEKAPKLAAAPNIKHMFFGRQSADGLPFNMSSNFDETGTATSNRQAAVKALDLDIEHLATVKQTHSSDVITLTSAPDPSNIIEADGLVTHLSGIALGILTADCTPVLIADPDAQVIGACHAGWRGAVGGIVTNTINAMCALGANPTTMIAAIGPTISAKNYEVGPQFTADLQKTNPKALPFIVYPDAATKAHFDLPGFVAAELKNANVGTIESAGSCTYAYPERYFSHRHTTHHSTKAGRQITLIALQ